MSQDGQPDHVAAPAHIIDVRLERGTSLRPLSDTLAERLERVRLAGVLAALNRDARPVTVRARAAVEGFTWRADDRRSLEWYPQGITWADSAETGGIDGRSVIVASWYAKRRRHRPFKGARVSFVDRTDPGRPRYRHVLLVEPVRDKSGEVSFRPVPVHAGGIVWYGGYLYVAGTARGIRVFELADLTAVPALPSDRCEAATRVGRLPGGGYGAFGHRFVLPQSFTYTAWTADGFEQLRYSFLSLDRTGPVPHMVAGEYGRNGATTRLVRYAVDPGTHLLSTRDDGHAWPVELDTRGLQGMQGATQVHGCWVISCSRGVTSRGDLWTGRSGDLQRHKGVLAVGPEDIAYWPARRQLWNLSEWPTRRWVYGLDARRWVAAMQ